MWSGVKKILGCDYFYESHSLDAWSINSIGDIRFVKIQILEKGGGQVQGTSFVWAFFFEIGEWVLGG